MVHPIYLDFAASTPLDTRVAEAMVENLMSWDGFANPSSLHYYGEKAKSAIELARNQVANLISAHHSEIIWTSGATEANNLAIKGVAHLYKQKGQHIITAKTEHKAVLDVCQHLEKQGYRITYLSPQKNGLIDLNELNAQLSKETILVSLMHVNNETGVISELEKIAELTASRNVFLHVDAAQSIGKLPLDVKQIPIDLMSMCAHKVYGPKGIGALYVRRRPRVRVEPLFHGGGHEQGMRSGTLPTHQIIGMGLAFELAHEALASGYRHVNALRSRFLQVLEVLPQVKLNADSQLTVPHILNLRFEKMFADALLKHLPEIAASTASACQGKSAEGSYVLRAMGLSLDEIKSSVRFSFGRTTTLAEVEQAADAIVRLFEV